MNHPSYSPNFASSDLFWPEKVHVGGQKFQSDDNSNVVSWTGYAVRIKPFMLLASVSCQDIGKSMLV
jgi:hypothetical protein